MRLEITGVQRARMGAEGRPEPSQEEMTGPAPQERQLAWRKSQMTVVSDQRDK